MPVVVLGMDEGWCMDEGLFMDQAAPAPAPVTPVPPVHKTKAKHMDFVPDKRNLRAKWYKNLSTNVVAEAVKMGAPPADATAVKALADGIIAKFEATDAAQTALAQRRDQFQEFLGRFLVQAGGRLVQDQDVGPAHEGARQHEFLALAP